MKCCYKGCHRKSHRIYGSEAAIEADNRHYHLECWKHMRGEAHLPVDKVNEAVMNLIQEVTHNPNHEPNRCTNCGKDFFIDSNVVYIHKLILGASFCNKECYYDLLMADVHE